MTHSASHLESKPIKKGSGSASLSRLLAWRFFRGGSSEALISLISTLSIAGMTLAVSVLVLVLSVMNGFESEFREKILGLAPHARLVFDEPSNDIFPLLDKIRTDPQVISAMAFTEFKALAISGSTAHPLLIQGLRFEQLKPFHKASIRTEKESQHTLQNLAAGEIILGAALAKNLGINTGDKLRLLRIEEGSSNSSASGAKTYVHSFLVVGLMHTGTELDNALGMIDLDYASDLKGITGKSEGVQFQFNDIFNAKTYAWQLAKNYSLYGHLSDWKSEYGNLYTAIQLSRQMVVMLVASIVAVAAFNIFVTLGMVVRHKQSEIAILRTMGMQRRQLLISLTWQGIFIALPGCILGLIIGVLLSLIAPSLVNTIQQGLGVELLNTEIYPINYLPVKIRAFDLVFIAVAALIMSYIATLYPAKQATSMRPADILKNKV